MIIGSASARVRWRTILALGGVAFLVAVGCASSSNNAAPLCTWLSKPNCYRVALDDARLCLPPPNEAAALSSDRTQCTFSNGYKLVLDTAYVADTLPLGATVVRPDGSACLRVVVSTANAGVFETVTTTHGDVHVDRHFTSATDRYEITCPDGTKSPQQDYTSEACRGLNPGVASSAGGQRVASGLAGTGDELAPLVWTCVAPTSSDGGLDAHP